MTQIPSDHPRYRSLITREQVIRGVKDGITGMNGLIAQGRGEAFDYLLGEETIPAARKAQYVASAMLLLARKPVISVNGNAAALVPAELVQLSHLLNAPLEVNLFYRTQDRVLRIIAHLKAHGAGTVLGASPDATISGLSSQRARVCSSGIYTADVVFVPLEDGDRCQALLEMGKQVIAVDLNPLSRTAQQATISIIDNIIRAIPNMIDMIGELKSEPVEYLQDIVAGFDNGKGLNDALDSIYAHLTKIRPD